ncbi:MAG: replication initiator protein A [Oscillospiraceae bacterium]
MTEAFYKFPHALFSEKYIGVSNEGKLLYCLMLDRLGLSRKNGWKDADGRTFIIFTREEASRTLCIGKDKTARIFSELERAELITQKKQYLGRPTLIYVNELTAEIQDTENRKSSSSDDVNADIQTSENPTCRERENGHSDSVKTAATKTNNNQNKKSQTDINHTDPIKTKAACGSDGMNCRNGKHNSEKLLKERVNNAIEIETLKRSYPASDNSIDEIRDIIVDVISGRRRVTFEGKTIPEDIAAERFEKLGNENVRMTLDALAESETEIRRVDAYIATMLYSSTFTAFSRNEVGWKKLI